MADRSSMGLRSTGRQVLTPLPTIIDLDTHTDPTFGHDRPEVGQEPGCLPATKNPYLAPAGKPQNSGLPGRYRTAQVLHTPTGGVGECRQDACG